MLQQLFANLLFAKHNRKALHCCLATAPQPAQPSHRTKLAHTHHAKMSSCVRTVRRYASTSFCACPMFAIHSTAARHCCLTTAPLRNQRNPCIEQSLRTRTMLKMSSCVQPAQLYASLPFGARPLFAMRNGAARHCCLTTAPVRHHRNPCIEQSLRKHTMLRCHPACIICFNNFLRTSTVCNAQLMRSPLLPRNCSANSATLASNKICAHAPC